MSRAVFLRSEPPGPAGCLAAFVAMLGMAYVMLATIDASLRLTLAALGL